MPKGAVIKVHNFRVFQKMQCLTIQKSVSQGRQSPHWLYQYLGHSIRPIQAILYITDEGQLIFCDYSRQSIGEPLRCSSIGYFSCDGYFGIVESSSFSIVPRKYYDYRVFGHFSREWPNLGVMASLDQSVPPIRPTLPQASSSMNSHMGVPQGVCGGYQACRIGDWLGAMLGCGHGQLYTIPARPKVEC